MNIIQKVTWKCMKAAKPSIRSAWNTFASSFFSRSRPYHTEGDMEMHEGR